MIMDHTEELITKLAKKVATQCVMLQQTTPLIMKENFKVDRIDVKMLKEADKRNQKEKLLNTVKLEHRRGQRKGAITYKSYTIKYKKDLITDIRERVGKGE